MRVINTTPARLGQDILSNKALANCPLVRNYMIIRPYDALSLMRWQGLITLDLVTTDTARNDRYFDIRYDH